MLSSLPVGKYYELRAMSHVTLFFKSQLLSGRLAQNVGHSSGESSPDQSTSLNLSST